MGVVLGGCGTQSSNISTHQDGYAPAPGTVVGLQDDAHLTRVLLREQQRVSFGLHGKFANGLRPLLLFVWEIE